MMVETEILTRNAQGSYEYIKINYSKKCPWIIKVINNDNIKVYHGENLFRCLCELRSDYEKRSIKICCAGARINAFPSRMSRQMGGARKVYLLEMGKQTSNEGIVDIFNEIKEIDMIATPNQQQEYYKKWLKSL